MRISVPLIAESRSSKNLLAVPTEEILLVEDSLIKLSNLSPTFDLQFFLIPISEAFSGWMISKIWLGPLNFGCSLHLQIVCLIILEL